MIWGKERVPAEFSPSNNYKDPRLGNAHVALRIPDASEFKRCLF